MVIAMVVGTVIWVVIIRTAIRFGKAAAKPWPDYTEQHNHEGQGECPACL